MTHNEPPASHFDLDEHPLVGRGQELARLRMGLAQAAAGQGGLTLVSGEAGIGKTSLVQALTMEARQFGARTLTGAAFDLSSTPPYGPWLELASNYQQSEANPDLPESLNRNATLQSSRSQDEHFHEALAFFIRLAEQQPVVVVLEDLHWSDENSLDLLRFIARYVARHPILIIATYRDDELNHEHPLYFRIPVLVRESFADRIELAPLDRSEISQLTKTRYELSQDSHNRLVEYLMKFTDGNPLFAVELTRTLERAGVLNQQNEIWELGPIPEEAAPSLIRQMVEPRMNSMSEATRRTLQRAAVFAAEVPLDVWEQLAPAGLSLSIAEEALESNLMTESATANALSFRHALIREVIHASLPLFTRREVHREVAELQMNGSPLDPDAVAYHLSRAGDPRAWEWLIRSGLRARSAVAWLNAAERFEEAARIMEQGQGYTRSRGWLLFYAAFLMRYSRDPRNIELLDEALQAAVDANDRLLRGYAHYHRGAARCMRRDIRLGLEELELGVNELEQLSKRRRIHATEQQSQAIIRQLMRDPGAEVDDRDCTGGSQVNQTTVFQRGVLVNWLAQSGQYLRASHMGETFPQPVEPSDAGDATDPSWSLGLGHSAAALGDVDRASRRYQQALERFREVGDYHMIEYGSWANLLMVTIPYFTDNTAERRRLVTQGDEAGRRASFIDGDDEFTWCSTLDNLLAGRLDLAYRASQRELDTSLSAIRRENAAVSIAGIHLLRGEYDQVWGFIAEVLPAGPDTTPGNNYFATAIQGHRIAAQTSLRIGDHRVARRWIESRDTWLRWSGAVLWNSEQYLLWAEYYLTSGETDRAQHFADQAIHAAIEPRQPGALLEAHRFLAKLAIASGDLERADSQIRAASELAGSCAIAYELAATKLVEAELEIHRGDQRTAQHMLDSAGALLEKLGARPDLERIDQLRGQFKLSRGNASGALSKRELEVLDLLTQGKSDREIARELYISHHTVMRHVSSILRKLGVASRTSATAMAVRDGLV